MKIEEIGKNIKTLLAIEEIKKLQARYCYFVDSGNSDELLDLFTDNARVEAGPFGAFDGKDAFTKFFTRIFPKALSFSMHMLHNPLVEIYDDNKARGKWYFLVPGTDKLKNKAVWVSGIYEEEFIKEDNAWKISLFKADFQFYTPFDEGWLKTKFMT